MKFLSKGYPRWNNIDGATIYQCQNQVHRRGLQSNVRSPLFAALLYQQPIWISYKSRIIYKQLQVESNVD